MAMEGDLKRVTALSKSEAIKPTEVKTVVTQYHDLFDEKKGGSVEVRAQSKTMVNDFYNMVTDIYEFGWGQSFHFAPRHKFESFEASIARHEMYLAHRLNLQKGQISLDLGCGVGGPGRVVARFSESKVVGLNNNDYQIQRCKKLTAQQGLLHLCSYMKADWMKIPVEDNTYDTAFHFEALEHSEDRVAACREFLRVIKPGGYFAGYDWIITDKCDLKNTEHVRIKKAIELGNGLPDLKRPGYILETLKEAGFEIIESRDLAIFNPEYDIPWYDSLAAKWNYAGFKHTVPGMWLTNKFVWMLESLRIAPKGTLDIHNMLIKVAGDLVAGGDKQIFSPMFFYLCRKPEK